MGVSRLELWESEWALPTLIPLLVIALAAIMLIVWRRGGFLFRGSSEHPHQGEVYSTFLPPIIGGVIPKEETYMVARDWRPTLGTSRVYAPLSIPIHEPTPTRSWSEMGGSIIHALPPPKSGPHAPAFFL